MELNQIIFIIFCIIIITFSLSQKKENFLPEIITNPGIWVGRQVGGLWNGMEPPARFARNIAYNYAVPFGPNYTWVDRYMDRRNEWVRANKGLPPLKPSPTENVVKLNMKMDNDTENKSFSIPVLGNNITQGYSQSLIGRLL